MESGRRGGRPPGAQEALSWGDSTQGAAGLQGAARGGWGPRRGWGSADGRAGQTHGLVRGEHACTGGGVRPRGALGSRVCSGRRCHRAQNVGTAHGPPGEHGLEVPQTSLQSDHSSHRCGQGLKTPKLDELSGILGPHPQPPLSAGQKTGTESGWVPRQDRRDAEAPGTRRLPPRRPSMLPAVQRGSCGVSLARV